MTFLASPIAALVLALLLAAATAFGWLANDPIVAFICLVLAVLAVLWWGVDYRKRRMVTRLASTDTTPADARVINRTTGKMDLENIEFGTSDRTDVDNFGEFRARNMRHGIPPKKGR